jgi:light-regulated signal transduction histidine kinase (bacteriophytochrome)
VHAAPVSLRPGLNAAGEALDQSLCVLRAVSPIHIEYLRNMGVKASMSISIIVEGRLWGLFACHHYEPRLPSFAQRSAAELFGQMFSMMLESRERREAAEYEASARNVADRLMAATAQDNDLLSDAQWMGEVILDTIPADGVGVYLNGALSLSGLTPNRSEFMSIVAMLNRLAASQVFTTDHIAGFLPEATSYANRAAGLCGAVPQRASALGALGGQPRQGRGIWPERAAPDSAQELRGMVGTGEEQGRPLLHRRAPGGGDAADCAVGSGAALVRERR